MYKRILLIATIVFSILLGSTLVPAYTDMGLNTVLAQGESLDDPNFMFDLSVVTHDDMTGSDKQNWIRKGINYIFERVIGILIASIGGIAILVMSYGGFLILTSGGGPGLEKGKYYVKYALIGLSFALLAYILVTAVQILIRSIYA